MGGGGSYGAVSEDAEPGAPAAARRPYAPLVLSMLAVAVASAATGHAQGRHTERAAAAAAAAAPQSSSCQPERLPVTVPPTTDKEIEALPMMDPRSVDPFDQEASVKIIGNPCAKPVQSAISSGAFPSNLYAQYPGSPKLFGAAGPSYMALPPKKQGDLPEAPPGTKHAPTVIFPRKLGPCTLLMMDLDAVVANNESAIYPGDEAPFLHWRVTNATGKIDANTTSIDDYLPPTPPAVDGQGSHRYALILFTGTATNLTEPTTKKEPSSAPSTDNREMYDAKSFISANPQLKPYSFTYFFASPPGSFD